MDRVEDRIKDIDGSDGDIVDLVERMHAVETVAPQLFDYLADENPRWSLKPWKRGFGDSKETIYCSLRTFDPSKNSTKPNKDLKKPQTIHCATAKSSKSRSQSEQSDLDRLPSTA